MSRKHGFFRPHLGRGFPQVSSTTLREGGGFTIASLFANGEDGFLFGNFAELDELFTLSTGPTKVVSDADAVGLAIDDHAFSDTLASEVGGQSNLLTPGSWAMSVAGGTSTATETPAGQLNLSADGTNQARGDQSFTTVAGRTYRLAATVAGSQAAAQVGATQGSSTALNVALTSGAGHYFVATSTTSWVRLSRMNVGSLAITDVSIKEIPGNHAVQATSTKRPLWKANSGKPYLNFDGSDDVLQSALAASAAITLAFAGRIGSGTTTKVAMGGGISTGNKRLYLGVGTADSGATLKAALGWGGEGASPLYGPDIKNTDVVLLLTGDGVSRDLYLNGELLSSAVPSGGPDGTGGAIAVGSWNNNGTATLFWPGEISAALAVNRRVTPAEIAGITTLFQRTF